MPVRQYVRNNIDVKVEDVDENEAHTDVNSDDELNEQLGEALKAIAAARRRRDQRSEELRPHRGVRVSWRRSLRVYVTPSPRKQLIDSWLVVSDHFQ